jgi:uncharacterized protein involved in exopolysaccharide biosynthesis
VQSVTNGEAPAPGNGRLEGRDALRRAREVLARYGALVAVFVGSATVTALALTYVFSERYVAFTTVLYRPQDLPRFQAKEEESMGFHTPQVPFESIGHTLNEIVRSEAVLRPVIVELNLTEPVPRPPATWYKTWYWDTKDWVRNRLGDAWTVLRYGRLIDRDPYSEVLVGLVKNVAVEETRKAYSFRLSVTDKYPERAVAIANAVAEHLRDFLRQQTTGNAGQARQEIAQRLTVKRTEIETLRKSLQEFKNRNRVTSLSEETSLKLGTISQFEKDLESTQNEIQSTRARLQELHGQLQKLENFVDYDSTTSDNPVFQELRLEMTRLEVRRASLLEKYTSEHQEVRATDAELASLRQKLADEAAKVVSSQSRRLNEVQRSVESETLEAEATLTGLEARRRALSSVVQDLRRELGNLPSHEKLLADLTMNLEVAEHALRLLNDAYEEASIQEIRQMSEVQILHEALLPTQPARPIKVYHVVAAFLLSLVLAAGGAFLLDYFDGAVRSSEALEEKLGLPVLSVIPVRRQT